MTPDRSWSPRLVAATLAAIVVIALAIVVATAPANWLALYVASHSRGVLLLADAQGTVWAGSAVVALGAPDPAPSATGADPSLVPGDRLALPGRVTWKIEWPRLLAPALQLTHDGVLLRPIVVRRADAGWSVDAGAAVVPASILRLAGAPLNTLMPDGRCELRWNALVIDGAGNAIGEGSLQIGAFALALSPVRPLGDYLVTWASDARGVTWQLATEHGPLALEGNGVLAGARSQVLVVVRAAPDASPAVAAQLGPLLDMIGRRGPNEAVVRMGSS